MKIQNKLIEFANEIALPYLLDHEDFQPYKTSIDILLVGSSATGLCDEKSDVDICILCSEQILNEISMKKEWNKGKPSEIIINGIQLHYYAASLENIHNKLKDFNESVFYLYQTSILLYQGTDRYKELKESLEIYSNMQERFDHIRNKLKARRRALGSILEYSKDPILRMKIGLEILELLLCATAQYDKVGYDKRKRLYQTSLIGRTGKNIKGDIDILIDLISKISDHQDKQLSQKFERIVDQCILKIS